MSRNVFVSLMAIGLASSAFAMSGGTTGMSASGCAGCHTDSGATATINVASTVSPGQTIPVTVSVTAPFNGGGGFDARPSAGTLAAGSGCQVSNGDATHTGSGSRSWSFNWTAPAAAGPVTIRVSAIASNGDGEPGGDAATQAQATVTVGAAAVDSDGDTTPDTADCAPNNAAVHPGAAESCTNGIDDDCDGNADAADQSCAGAEWAHVGDLAPRNAPDSQVTIADVVLMLRFAVDLDNPTELEQDRGDVAPGSVTDANASPDIFTPASDGVIDIGDAVVELRAAVGLIQFGPAPDPCAHQLPVANAGADQRVVRTTVVGLSGAASTEVETWAWTLTTRPAGSTAVLTGANTGTPSFTADVVGTYVASLVVRNCRGTSVADTVSITASELIVAAALDTSNYNNAGQGAGQRNLSGNKQYTANFGAANVRLKGDGSRGVGAMTYRWEQTMGMPVTLSSSTAANPTFTAPTLQSLLDARGTNRWGVLPITYSDLEMGFRLTVTTPTASGSAIAHVYLEEGGYEVAPRTSLLRAGRGGRVYLEGARTEADGDVITQWGWTVAGPEGDATPVIRDATSRTPSFVPAAAGLYTIGWRSAATATNAPTDAGSFVMTIATYVGSSANTTSHSRPGCAGCHDGTIQPDVVTPFMATNHSGVQFQRVTAPYMSGFFKTSQASIAVLDPTKNPAAYALANPTYCLRCHTGWNTQPGADNGGLDDLFVAASFSTPPTGVAWDDLVRDYPAIANMAGEQCEACHGPGSRHDGDLAGQAMGTSLESDVCGQCHSGQYPEWSNSLHSRMVTRDSSYSSGSCVRCHSGIAFIRDAEGTNPNVPTITTQQVLTCASCHDPHSAEHDMQLRKIGESQLANGLVVDAGAGASCIRCHDGRYPDPEAQARASSRSSHHNTQGPVLVGAQACVNFSNGAITLTENSFHSTDAFVMQLFTHSESDSDTNDACVTCHMAPGPAEGQPGFEEIGGHTWNVSEAQTVGTYASSVTFGPATMTANTSLVTVPGAAFTDFPEDAVFVNLSGSSPVTYPITRLKDSTTFVLDSQASATATINSWRIDELEMIENLGACTTCHTTMTEFDRLARADYDGDGRIEGVQEEVQGLLDILGSKIVAIDAVDVGGARTVRPATWEDGSLLGLATPLTNTSNDILYAVFNWNIVHHDGSYGLHNTAFTVQLLQKTYTAISTANPTVDDPRTPGNDANKTFTQAYPAATIR